MLTAYAVCRACAHVEAYPHPHGFPDRCECCHAHWTDLDDYADHGEAEEASQAILDERASC